jgi:hypothetical protein
MSYNNKRFYFEGIKLGPTAERYLKLMYVMEDMKRNTPNYDLCNNQDATEFFQSLI